MVAEQNRALVVREDNPPMVKRPLRLGILEEETNMGPLLGDNKYTIDDFEADELPIKQRHRGTLNKITTHFGVDTLDMVVHLSQENEMEHESVHGLRAWSTSHHQAGATLPLH